MLGKLCVLVELFVLQGVYALVVLLVVVLIYPLGGLLHAYHEVFESLHSLRVILVLVNILLREFSLQGLLINRVLLQLVRILRREVAHLRIFEPFLSLLFSEHETLILIKLNRGSFHINGRHFALLSPFFSVRILLTLLEVLF